MEGGSWVEFNKLLDKLIIKDVEADIIVVERRKLTDPEDYDFNVRTNLRYPDYSVLTATTYIRRE